MSCRKLNLQESYPQLSNQALRAATDGCFISYCDNNDHCRYNKPYWEWPALEKQGEVADGVYVHIDGQIPIIVSPTRGTVFWSKNEVLINGDVGESYEKAVLDYSGKEKTAELMAKGRELFGDEQETWKNNYAAPWCAAYNRSHEDGNGSVIGYGAGRWWLPSMGQLIAIWKRKESINRCLEVISGAQLLTDGITYSSTERSARQAWRINMALGYIQSINKTSPTYSVRAVTSIVY